jgi:TolB-like protein
VAEASHAVFLSYASQDAGAARKICEALRAAGIEVFLDQSELRGGDAWDRQIRAQIHECRLFIPIVSANTDARIEGYFRREWQLAVERTHDLSERAVFLVPVVIDATSELKADVPDAFRHVQWTRLPDGGTPPQFVTRIQQLLSGEHRHSPNGPRWPAAVASGRPSRLEPAWLAVAVVLTAVAVSYVLIEKLWVAKPGPPAAFAPPTHSIAVLPFVNLSGDKEQEYFSDGLTEELLNSLAAIGGLQVAARTSSFSFKEHPDIVTVAHKLNVASVLEGSVRRSEHTVRVTAQLINATTGFHIWSKTYDRDLGDVLKLQTEIATAVADALKVTLLGDVAARIELGGTRNSAAFDAYLRGRKAQLSAFSDKDYRIAIDAYTQAIALDPNYALAFANRSVALSSYAGEASGPMVHESFAKALSDAQEAIALAPNLAEGHVALASYFEAGSQDFTRANEEYERALALAPGNVRVLQDYGTFAVAMGRTDTGIAAARRAVVLDPLNRDSHYNLGSSLYRARQNSEAIAALQDALALDPEDPFSLAFRGLAYYALGDFENARASCESKPDDGLSQQCLAVTYDKLGRHADAEAALAKLRAAFGDASAYQYATVFAQWGNTPKALEWLDTAMRLRDSGLEYLKTDPLMDPLRQKPRFQAVMRELNFPQ